MEPVVLYIYGDISFILKTPFYNCLLLGILAGCYLIPCLYSICFSRVFILRHHRPLMVFDLLLSNAAVFFTFYWLNGFADWPFFAPTLVAGLVWSSLIIWGTFDSCYLAWVKGNAKLENYLTPFTFLVIAFSFCLESEYLPFSDFLGLLWNKLAFLFP